MADEINQKRDSAIIYRSFYEAIKDLPEKNQAEMWTAIFEYSLNFKELELKGLSATVFKLIKPQLDANNKRYANGTKPKKKQNGSKTEANEEQSASETEANKNENNNDNVNANQNKPLKGREHFEHLKSFFSKQYQQQTQEFKNLYTEKEYNDFGKFLKAMLNDFQEQLEQKFDKCLSIGEWKSIFKCAGYMRVKPAIIKTLGAAQGDRQNMAARIFTYTGEEFTDKAFKL